MEKLIGDLLLRHNCVIVPSFGGFVAKQVAAQVDFTTGKMSPPRKSLLFNKQLINNDGLLINELAMLNDITFDAAAVIVKEKALSWNHTLKMGGRVELDRVGFLYFDEEKNICFEQDRFFNLLMASFGLGQVHFLTEQDVKIADQKAVRIIERTISSPKPALQVSATIPKEQKSFEKKEGVKMMKHPAIEKERSRTKAWRYVAAACFLPIAFYSVWIPMKTDVLESGMISLNDFNPFKHQVASIYVPAQIEEITVAPKKEASLKDRVEEITTDVDVYTFKFDENFFVPVDIRKQAAALVVHEEKLVNSETSFELETMHYIVGCFSDKTNAENMVERLKSAGLTPKIVDVHNGLHRVSAGGAASPEGLQTIKMTAHSMDLSGWMLKK